METPFLHSVNWVDILILAFLGRGAYLGFAKGSAWGIVRLIGVLFVTAVAFSKSYPLTRWTEETFGVASPFLEWVFFIFLGIVLGNLINYCISVITGMLGLAPQGWVGRAAGMILGVMQASVLASLLFVTLVMSTSSYLSESVKERSFLGPYFMKITPVFFTGFQEWVPGKGKPSTAVWKQVTEVK